MAQAYSLIDQSRALHHHRTSPLSRPGNVTFGVATLMVLVICFALSVAALSHAERSADARFAHPVRFSAHRNSSRARNRVRSVIVAAAVASEVRSDYDFADDLAGLENSAAYLIGSIVSAGWNNVRWFSDQLLAMMNDAGLPSAGNSIFPAFSTQLDLIATALTVALMLAVLLSLTAPIYAIWKSHRMNRARVHFGYD